MKILPASALGLCFGVRDALALARQIERPADITINGQLVHNPLITRELQARGFQFAEESSDQIPASPAILITAHGISNRRRNQLSAAGKVLIDATCPLVKKAHAAALHLQSLGFHVLVIGKPNHVEIRGLTGDLRSFTILEFPADARPFPQPKLGLIAQTTTPESAAHQIVQQVREQNPHAQIRFINTICQPTRDRQIALQNLLAQIDLLVVVGGRNSSNTLHLVHQAQAHRIPAIHIEQAAELRETAFHPNLTIGLTAGTSTLPETIDEVQTRLQQMFTTISI